jgi:hypothetical protein
LTLACDQIPNPERRSLSRKLIRIVREQRVDAEIVEVPLHRRAVSGVVFSLARNVHDVTVSVVRGFHEGGPAGDQLWSPRHQ